MTRPAGCNESVMLRFFSLALFFSVGGFATLAQDAVKLDKLPDAFVITSLAQGDLEEEGDLLLEAFEEADEAAKARKIATGAQRVIIYEVMGLKTFRARAGFVLPAEPKYKGPFKKNIVLRKLPQHRAYVAFGSGGWSNSKLISVRSQVLKAAWKVDKERLKGIELIEIYEGDPDEEATKFAVYAPLR
jgi:hypothetical protein